ncbi:TonB-dependent receptor [Candidatus Koribacter versatilis Ellin345]|uniref:TonB-dependent receptor n=1 Tax=Koribacter versatilis (strain Ellin345) TaxID=204669 RepID=Q1II17_KORVE|nr:TonB-dependent receptor [Candidatus Koribacter versatilis]ABF43483.1 TonB-dependent receptor [Candidatus Koribacter versatilis Ellin345]
MRRLLLSCCLLFPAALFAGELTIHVVDPDQRPVVNANVALYSSNHSEVRTTGADGAAHFSNVSDGSYNVQVLAPGFAKAEQPVQLPERSDSTVALSVENAAESVVVTATSSPVSEAESGSAVSTLDAQQLTLKQATAASDALRFMPGVLVTATGQRGSLTTVNVRGGESRYNHVIVDGVPVNEPGGQFDFGVVPTAQMDRIEVVRGSDSAVYGSDAMSSVVQMFSATGTTRTPEFRFGADGGNFGTAHGFLSIAGAWRRFDYNLFGDQFNTNGQGLNNAYSNGLEGLNLGYRVNQRAQLRFRLRHANSWSGTSNEWWFNGDAALPADSDQYARQTNFLADLDLTIAGPGAWQHRFSGFEYNHDRRNVDSFVDPGRPADFDQPFDSAALYNRAGFDWQSDYSPRSWTRTSIGYHFEKENGNITSNYSFFGFPEYSVTIGQRNNQAVFGQQMLLWKRFSLLAGLRWEHNESFGDKAIPRAALSFVVLRGGEIFSGTRLRGSYSTGVVEPSFEETFGISGTFPTLPNPDLKPEQARSFEAGLEQGFLANKVSLYAAYYNSIYRDQIQFYFDPITFNSQYRNINRALAHGAEVDIQARLNKSLSVSANYTYTSSQILSALPCDPAAGCDPRLFGEGSPLLHRPRHFGNLMLSYSRSRWGAQLAGVAVGRRADDDFGLAPAPISYAAGYARFDASGYYTVSTHVTAYVNMENLLNHYYNEVVGYPSLGFNFRAGLRFRFGGE